MNELTTNEIKFLRQLVRQNIKKKRRSLDKFAARPGQSLEDVETAREKLNNSLGFSTRAEQKLNELYRSRNDSAASA